jgi:phycobilisome core linker protein
VYILPSGSRGYSFRELQQVYTTKNVPFSSWYAEQQRIQKMGGTILKVELASGGQQRSVSSACRHCASPPPSATPRRAFHPWRASPSCRAFH